jgi:hypothetical protein
MMLVAVPLVIVAAAACFVPARRAAQGGSAHRVAARTVIAVVAELARSGRVRLWVIEGCSLEEGIFAASVAVDTAGPFPRRSRRPATLTLLDALVKCTIDIHGSMREPDGL